MTLTTHAKQRIRQRGFKEDLINFLLDFGDYSNCGKNAYRISVSKKKLNDILKSSHFSKEIKKFIRKNYELLIKKVLIVADAITTAFNKNK